MMSSATKGREVRNWFIQKEKNSLLCNSLRPPLPSHLSPPPITPLRCMRGSGKFFNAPLHLVQQELVKYITREIGLDLMPLLSGAPAQENIQPEEEMLEPTELAKQLNVKSGKAMNLLLAQIGWQIQQIGGVWRPTPAGSFTPYDTLGPPNTAPNRLQLEVERRELYAAFSLNAVLFLKHRQTNHGSYHPLPRS